MMAMVDGDDEISSSRLRRDRKGKTVNAQGEGVYYHWLGWCQFFPVPPFYLCLVLSFVVFVFVLISYTFSVIWHLAGRQGRAGGQFTQVRGHTM